MKKIILAIATLSMVVLLSSCGPANSRGTASHSTKTNKETSTNMNDNNDKGYDSSKVSDTVKNSADNDNNDLLNELLK